MFFFEIKHEHHEKLEKKHMFNQIATCWTLVCGLNLFEFIIKSILFLIPNQMSDLINKIILNSICLACPNSKLELITSILLFALFIVI